MTAPLSSSASQITLVNPVPDLELSFTKSSVINTVVLKNGKPYLQIKNVDPAAAKTTVIDCISGEVLATTKRHTFTADTVQFMRHYDGKVLKVKDWLVEDKTSDGKRWSIETPVGRFTWRKDVQYRLVLCPDHDLTNPVVWVQSEPYALLLKSGTEAFHEVILASYSLLEQQMRMKEKAYSVAEGFNADDRTVAGMAVSTGNFNMKS